MSVSWKGLVDMRNLQILVSPALLKGHTEIYEFPYLPLASPCSTVSKFRDLKKGVERKSKNPRQGRQREQVLS